MCICTLVECLSSSALWFLVSQKVGICWNRLISDWVKTEDLCSGNVGLHFILEIQEQSLGVICFVAGATGSCLVC